MPLDLKELTPNYGPWSQRFLPRQRTLEGEPLAPVVISVATHSMAGLDKEVRARKCLKCGSEAHRQRDCTVGKSQPKSAQGTSRPTWNEKDTTPRPTSTQSTMATLGTTTSATSGETPTVAGTPWTLETLIQAAQQVVQPQGPQTQEDSGGEFAGKDAATNEDAAPKRYKGVLYRLFYNSSP